MFHESYPLADRIVKHSGANSQDLTQQKVETKSGIKPINRDAPKDQFETESVISELFLV
jgi:hypothetical protein